MNELYETMTKLKIGIYTVRVWCESPTFMFGDPQLEVLVTEFAQPEPKGILARLKDHPYVSAIEITTASGQGVVWYKDWP